MKRIIIDLDNTITLHKSEADYSKKKPNSKVIMRLREYKAQGFGIAIHTSRNMKTYEGDVGKINVHTLPSIIAWLDQHEVPYDEIYVGKPWCGSEGFYVDDRAVRPSEFAELSMEELFLRLDKEK